MVSPYVCAQESRGWVGAGGCVQGFLEGMLYALGPLGGLEIQGLGQEQREEIHSSEQGIPRHTDEAINLGLSF